MERRRAVRAVARGLRVCLRRRLGVARGGGRLAAGARSPINAVLFAVFALHHSLFARESIKTTGRARRTRPICSAPSTSGPQACSCSACSRCGNRSAATSMHVTGWPAFVHAAVQLSGIWLIARSVARIDPLELAGIKPAVPQRCAANRRPVPLGPPPALPRMAAGAVRRGAHDRRSPRVCRDQHGISAGGDSVGRTIAAAAPSESRTPATSARCAGGSSRYVY